MRVSEPEFDTALARILAGGIRHYATPRRERPGEINPVIRQAAWELLKQAGLVKAATPPERPRPKRSELRLVPPTTDTEGH